MSDFDPKSRELCPDGACIGVIGPEGTCKECGRVSPNEVSDPRNQGLDLEAAEEDELPEELAERRLCPDGACIGVLGEDGRCKECGRTPEEIEGDQDEEEDEDWDEEDEDLEEDEGEDDDEDLEEDEGEDDDDDEDLEEDEASPDPDEDRARAELPQAPKGWAKRRLCPDESCVGVLDENGKCPVCGGHAPAANSSN